MLPSSSRQTKRFLVIFLITLIAFNHFVRLCAGAAAVGTAVNPTGAFPKTLGEALSSLNGVRVLVGQKIVGAGSYCPVSGQQYCRTVIEGFVTILGLS